MVVGVGFCKIKVDSKFLIVLKIKCTKFHQDRSKTVDLHTQFINRHSVLYRCPRTRGSNLNCIFLDGNEGKKPLETYSGCNSFLVMN
jgi:hypothetical protein